MSDRGPEWLRYFTTGTNENSGGGQVLFDFNTVGVKQPELFWTAAVLRGDEVVWSKPSHYASSRDAIGAARMESVRFPDATHVRASNGVDNVLERV